LALALAAEDQASQVDDASFMPYYRSALAALDLLAARDAEAAIGDRAANWAGTAASAASGSLESTASRNALNLASDEERAAAWQVLDLSDEQLLAKARDSLKAAKARNPLQIQVNELLELLSARATTG
jgi:hypothetical protein